MEIIATFTQHGPSLEDMSFVSAALCLAVLALRGLGHVWRRRPVLRFSPATFFSVFALPGLAGGGTSLDALTTRRGPSSIDHSQIRIPPALYERVPPPRSLVRAGDITRTVHPAIHRSEEPLRAPLFPRAGRGLPELEPWERGLTDLRRRTRAERPGMSEKRSPRQPDHYTVLPGDTLWGIAARVLRTDDVRAIARFWPKIHRANVDVIGRNPDLVRPGQVLYIPRTQDV